MVPGELFAVIAKFIVIAFLIPLPLLVGVTQFSRADASCVVFNTEMTVAKGEVFSIEVESPGASGYMWEVEGLDPSYLIFLGREQDGAETGKFGAAVRESWRFKADKAGETSITMKLLRPWDKEHPAEIRHIKITISKEVDQ